MYRTRISIAGVVGFALAVSVAQAQSPPKMKMTTPIPADITTPDLEDTRLGTLKFFDGFRDEATVQNIYDNLDFHRGVQAFLTAMPGASLYAFRAGASWAQTVPGKGWNVLLRLDGPEQAWFDKTRRPWEFELVD